MTVERQARSALKNVPIPPAQIIGLAVATLVAPRLPGTLPGGRPAHRAIGALLAAAGTATVAWALWERNRRSAESFDLERPAELVTTGPYAISRHPMYVGWWLLHLGAGVFRGSGWVLVTVPAAAMAEHPMVRTEERRLAALFEPGYREYASRVPRYFPGARVRRRQRRSRRG